MKRFILMIACISGLALEIPCSAASQKIHVGSNEEISQWLNTHNPRDYQNTNIAFVQDGKVLKTYTILYHQGSPRWAEADITYVVYPRTPKITFLA